MHEPVLMHMCMHMHLGVIACIYAPLSSHVCACKCVWEILHACMHLFSVASLEAKEQK